MTLLDYFVLGSTLLLIVGYGTYKTRINRDIKGYLLGDKELKWTTIGLSVMATQASAITFLSTPGQAYESGMAFVQNYFGLPLALIVVSAVFIPIYYKLKVFTAYEYLEKRFDLKSRMLAAFLFLVQRGLAAGITIYAPAIVLSSVLGWNLSGTIIVVGVLVIIYTVSGGTKAVSLTQKWQMAVILFGMAVAFGTIIYNLPPEVGFMDGLHLAGKMGKTDAIDFSLDWDKRYTFWSGITGGFFLALSYFGTDQSQVQRYLGGASIKESRMGLMFNAILKIPMQFFILLTGVMVFIFYQFQPHDVLFDTTSLELLEDTPYKGQLAEIRAEHYHIHQEKKQAALHYLNAKSNNNSHSLPDAELKLNELKTRAFAKRDEAKDLVQTAFPEITQKDSDYVFISYILNFMPSGLVGLLLAVIISAAMSSTAGELNALGSTTSVDFYKRIIKRDGDDRHYLIMSKVITACWGMLAVGFALYADLFENLIEAVNILGSLFYGTILGIFLTAFFFKFVRGNAVFFAAIISQVAILVLYYFQSDHISYLYFNLIGCALVISLSIILALTQSKNSEVEV